MSIFKRIDIMFRKKGKERDKMWNDMIAQEKHNRDWAQNRRDHRWNQRQARIERNKDRRFQLKKERINLRKHRMNQVTKRVELRQDGRTKRVGARQDGRTKRVGLRQEGRTKRKESTNDMIKYRASKGMGSPLEEFGKNFVNRAADVVGGIAGGGAGSFFGGGGGFALPPANSSGGNTGDSMSKFMPLAIAGGVGILAITLFSNKNKK